MRHTLNVRPGGRGVRRGLPLGLKLRLPLGLKLRLPLRVRLCHHCTVSNMH